MKRYFKFKEEDKTTIAYVYENKKDNVYHISNMLKVCCTQAVDDREDYGSFEFRISGINSMRGKKFNHLAFMYYGCNHISEDIKDMIKFDFDFENSIVYIDGKKYKVEDGKYVMKILKTKIKASGGIDGLYTNILISMNNEDLFHDWLYRNVKEAV